MRINEHFEPSNNEAMCRRGGVQQPARGFTLIEVMVALMVIAIALPALLSALYGQVDGTAYLRDKSIAQWVAGNQMAATRIRIARQNRVGAGQRSGVSTMAERDWFWWVESSATEVEDFFRVEVRVAREENREDQPLYTLVAFVAARGATSNAE